MEWTTVGTFALKMIMDWLFTEEAAATLIVAIGALLFGIVWRLFDRWRRVDCRGRPKA